MAETLTEQELVERFGTEKQKEYFAEHGKMRDSYKQSLINRAEKYCTIRQLKNGNYSLTKQKQVPINPDYIKSATGLYQYTCPLVLDYILNAEKDKTVIGMVSLAEKSNIITEYYKTIKDSPDITADTFHLNERIAYDCVKHMADSLNYYIEQTLKYLKQMQLIIYTTNYLVFRNEVGQEVGEDGKVRVYKKNHKPTIATDEEMEIYRMAVEQADIYAETKNASERYYSEKAQKWSKKFHELLLQHGIVKMCEAYEIWTVHPDRCVKYRKEFEQSTDKIIYGLAKDFKNKLITNAKKRISDESAGIDEIELVYNFITRICIGNSTLNKRIKDKLKNIKFKSDSQKIDYNEYDI